MLEVSLATPSVHLFDAHVYIFRAHFSLPAMYAPDGTPTHAAYGFANTLIKYLDDFNPQYVACCFDHALQSFRNEEYESYKESRLDAPPELEVQFDLCKDVAEALGFTCYEAPGYEADDVLATLVDQILDQKGQARVVTSDKDLCQLVTEDGRVEVYDLARDRFFDANRVREKFGVSPEQIPDYLGLVGDAVDDLPGVPGIGPKSAAAALSYFGSLVEFPENLTEWEGVSARAPRSIGERIIANRDLAVQMRELATVVRDIPGMETSLEELMYKGALRGQVRMLFGRLDWGGIATRIHRWSDEFADNDSVSEDRSA